MSETSIKKFNQNQVSSYQKKKSSKASLNNYGADDNVEIIYNDSIQNEGNPMDQYEHTEEYSKKASKLKKANSVNDSVSKNSGGRTTALRKKHAEELVSKSKMNKYREIKKGLK